MSSYVLKFVLVLLIVVVEIDVSFKSVLALTHGSSHQHLHDGREASSDFSNQWIVHLEGSSEAADLLAMKLGYKNLGEIDTFPGYYVMEKLDHPISARDEMKIYTRDLMEEVQVRYAQQLFTKVREKRYPSLLTEHELLREAQGDHISEKGISPELLALWEDVQKENESQSPNSQSKRDTKKAARRTEFNDNLWDKQWYMHDVMTRSDEGSEMDLHVMPVYAEGITGKGINVVVLDDGFEWKHPDIRANYRKDISWDYNGKDDDPTPSSSSNAHGTRCAGEIAMLANNQKCGVGIAYNSNIGGVRMLDGSVTDLLEGKAIAHAHDKVDVYSASWGPSDNGKTVEGPGRMAGLALEKGIKEGRKGKGVIYVWAAGNGGSKGDNCNCDGYTSSIYTLSIGSASQQGKFPWYGEKCASTMATTFSSGSYADQKIATIDVNSGCTVSHTGTSAAAPLAAGIVALLLEANPDLGWRDVQHMVARTSSKGALRESGWQRNGAGLDFNAKFGFGVMNADRLVKLAKKYTKKVGEQKIDMIEPTYESSLSTRNQNIPLVGGNPVTVEFDASSDDNKVKFLEHVEVLSNIHYHRRGCLEIDLESPSGTKSTVLTGRYQDSDNTKGFENWKFMSVHFWGENPKGTWKFHVRKNQYDENCRETRDVTFGDMKLTLYGTEEQPQVVELEPRPNDVVDRNLDYPENNSNVDQTEYFRQRREPQINLNTNWKDLIGQNVAVRNDGQF